MWCLSPSSVTMVTMQENSGKYSSSPDMAYILPAYNPDNTDDVSLKFDPPQHGNLTLYRQVKIINLIEQDCSQPWDIRHPLWNKLTKLISDSVTILEVSLTMFKYRSVCVWCLQPSVCAWHLQPSVCVWCFQLYVCVWYFQPCVKYQNNCATIQLRIFATHYYKNYT